MYKRQVIGDGNTDMVYEMAQTDRKMMKAEGLNIMYGPQVDVTSDPPVSYTHL